MTTKNLQPSPTSTLKAHWIEVRYNDGTSSYVNVANIGAGAAGAAMDTAASAHQGVSEIADVSTHS